MLADCLPRGMFVQLTEKYFSINICTSAIKLKWMIRAVKQILSILEMWYYFIVTGMPRVFHKKCDQTMKELEMS